VILPASNRKLTNLFCDNLQNPDYSIDFVTWLGADSHLAEPAGAAAIERLKAVK
jgi:hypothetical protein